LVEIGNFFGGYMAAIKISVRCIHELKTWPTFYQAIVDGVKPFELRTDDRDFQVGDVLLLREFDLNAQKYTGRKVCRLVTYKLESASFCGIEKGWCIMGLGVLPPEIKVEIANINQQTNGAAKPKLPKR
jgi:hypothetical protein